jgi:signal transduction histidine kinase
MAQPSRLLPPKLRRRVGGWQPPRWQVVGLLLAMVVIVILPYLVTNWSTRDALDAGSLVTHSSEVKSLTYRIAYVTRDSEAATYRLLDGDHDPLLMARAQQATKAVPALLGQLQDMTSDSPAQQAAVGALSSVVNGRMAMLTQAMHRSERGDKAGAIASLRDAGNLFDMDDQIEVVIRNEGSLLMDRRALARQRSFDSRLVLAATSVTQLLLLLFIVLVSERQIGRRVRAEARESRAVRRAQVILHAVREPIALLDANLGTLLVNTAFSELYGLPQEQRRLVRPLASVGNGAWDDDALLQRLRDVLLLDRELWDYEMKQRTAGGADRRVVINARRLQQDDSDMPVLLLTVSDITTRAMVERKVKELNRQLEGKIAQITDVNRELEAFSYSVSHDLRAPLRHISGFAGKLERHLDGRLDDKGRHYLEVIDTAAQRMAQLIDDLLVFSRLGRGALRLQAVDMQSLVDDARALVESELAASGQADRCIVWSIQPMPVVVGDENMLRTVWQNLLGNAVKYTGKCEVARIAVEVGNTPEGDYEFTVADNGAGFDMDYAGKLFGVFQRLHRASDFPGNGIGLANVRRIIGRHGGRVWAEAELGHGARFHFSLPAADLGNLRNQDSI